MATQKSSQKVSAPEEVLRPENFQYRVLLFAPESRHIPYFALFAERKLGRVRVTIISSKDAQSRLVGGNLFRSLEERYGSHIYIDVRRRVCGRTALYSTWLAFPTAGQAEKFVAENRKFGLENIKGKAAAQRANVEQQLQNGLSQGRYDLGQLKESLRSERAKHYILTDEKLRGFRGAEWGIAELCKDLEIYPDGITIG
ncbi:hypothetical protein [Methylobacterium oxalidis]|uniref:hypothetical protein n=1 Tax=Methylobacterium oxalidis TaxID=944322 RepID=UPI0033157953